MRTVFVNGNYVPEDEAKISVFDRGFLFADAIYEVTSVFDGKLLDFQGHTKRLHRSLSELKMDFRMSDEALLEAHRELVRLNDIKEGLVYLQISRGAADRDFAFPPKDTPETVVMFTQQKKLLDNPLVNEGQKVIFVEDQRWGRCDIKTVQLLFPSLAKMEAKAQGCHDAWMTRDGYITEGSSNNAYIVTEDGTIVTRQLSNEILAGITRSAVLKCAELLQMKVEIRAFTMDEARNAKEAFATSATGFVNPIVEIDGAQIGTGKPGPVADKLRAIYLEECRKNAL